MDVEKLLQQVRDGKISVQEAAEDLKNLPYENLGYARIDHHRKLRSGFDEVVFCQGKEDEYLCGIFENFYKHRINVLGTRAGMHQYEILKERFPELVYDRTARIVKIEFEKQALTGNVAVCTAGTADIPVAEEAAQCAEFFGTRVFRYYDIGVAGIHRLLSKREEICQANCVIAIAGMEGALGSVLAGLVDKPVIAVPTSIGYGANFGGVSALLSMLNSCANGISAVNIDNGYGAAYIATQINRLAEGKRKETSGAAPGTGDNNEDFISGM